MYKILTKIDRQLNQIIEVYGDRGDENLGFDNLALTIFEFQFDYNKPYRNHCLHLGVKKEDVRQWSEIPFMLTEDYKKGAVETTVPICREGLFYETSGTTSGIRGRVYRDPGFFLLRERAIWAAGRRELFFRFGDEKVDIAFLDFPDRRKLGYPLSYSVLYNIQKYFGSEKSKFFDITSNSECQRLIDMIEANNRMSRPLVILGPSYHLSRFLNFLHLNKLLHITLPQRSMVLDSGGLKNKAFHRDYEEYVSDLLRMFSIGRKDYINTYALTEIGTQFSDDARNCYGNDVSKKAPPWARVRIVKGDVNKIIDCSEEEIGTVIVYDLLNRGSIFALRTSDSGIKTQEGFKIYEGRII